WCAGVRDDARPRYDRRDRTEDDRECPAGSRSRRTVAPALAPGSSRGLDERHHLVVLEKARGVLGGLEDRLDPLLRRLDAAPLEPENDVRTAAHGPHADLLLEPQLARGDPRVDAVGEGRVPLLEGLDDGC